jgi:hypothetical protein
VLLIAATSRPLAGTADPRLTWVSMAHRGCTIHEVDALDEFSLLSSPYVGLVAKYLNDAIAKLPSVAVADEAQARTVATERFLLTGARA